MTLLRTYEHTAQQPHWCDRCNKDIEPGERYQGRVYATRRNLPPTLRMTSTQNYREVVQARVRKGIMVIKEHSKWCHDPFEEEMREETEREKNQNEETLSAA